MIRPLVSILDGDTIEVLHNHHPEHIRLSGIDCPEKGQVFLILLCSKEALVSELFKEPRFLTVSTWRTHSASD